MMRMMRLIYELMLTFSEFSRRSCWVLMHVHFHVHAFRGVWGKNAHTTPNTYFRRYSQSKSFNFFYFIFFFLMAAVQMWTGNCLA